MSFSHTFLSLLCFVVWLLHGMPAVSGKHKSYIYLWTCGRGVCAKKAYFFLSHYTGTEFCIWFCVSLFCEEKIRENEILHRPVLSKEGAVWPGSLFMAGDVSTEMTSEMMSYNFTSLTPYCHSLPLSHPAYHWMATLWKETTNWVEPKQNTYS